MREKTAVNDASAGIKIAQVAAKLAQDRSPIDPRACTQMFDALKPTFGNLLIQGLARLELRHQEAIQVVEQLLAARLFSACGTTRLQKGLESERQRAAEKASGHMLILSWAKASPLREGL